MTLSLKTLWQRGRGRLVVGAAALIALVAATGAFRLTHGGPSLPTAEVKRGEFLDNLSIRGEVKAAKSIVLTAPAGAGDNLQIVKLVKSGEMVKPGDVVVQFDITDLHDKLDTRNSDLKTEDAQIEGVRAQGRLTEEQDRTDLAKAKFDVERAQLDAGKEEILSAIDGEKAKLVVVDAKQSLKETTERMGNDNKATEASLGSEQEKRGKALFDVQQAQRNIDRMTLHAPIAGMVTVLPNFRAISGFFIGSPPEFREGDRAWPGAGVIALPDLNTIQISARVDETDRGRLAVGQQVTVRVDAVPDKEFSGTVAEISPLTKIDYSGWPPVKNFDLRVHIDGIDQRLRPGMSASARIVVDRKADAIIIPAEASFQKSGRTLAYVAHGSRWEERTIEVSRRSNGELAIASGLRPGERVALKDPTLTEKDKP